MDLQDKPQLYCQCSSTTAEKNCASLRCDSWWKISLWIIVGRSTKIILEKLGYKKYLIALKNAWKTIRFSECIDMALMLFIIYCIIMT